MTRAWLPAWLLALLVGLLIPASLAGAVHSAAGTRVGDAPKPNVLFIAVDDLNVWIGALGGHPDVKTPNIDRLARRGVLFTRAYCPAPACNPSRASLLSGLRPSTTGVYHNDQPWRRVMPDVVTLPQHFRANGYHVVGGGKIFHNSFNDPQSWDIWMRGGGFPGPASRPANGIPRTAQFDWGPIDVPDEAMGDYRVIQQAIDYLQQTHDRPFFLAPGLIRPHLPWYVPRKYFEMYPLESVRLPEVKADDLADVPKPGVAMAGPEGDHRRVTETRNWPKAVQAYMASISFADAQIGRLLDGLDRSPHAKNTIVVFWGDHGWHLGEKEHWRKFALWEEATHLPLIIAAPGQGKSDARCRRPVNLLDLYPTLIDLCRLTPRTGLEGQSLAPLIQDPKAKWDRPSITTHGLNNHAVRSERWRYIRYADGSEELYDHQRDPHEWTNVAEKKENRKVKAELAAWLPKVNAPNAPRAGGGVAE